MKTALILLTIIGLSTLGRGWAAEVSTARAPRDHHDREIGARTSGALHGAREPMNRNPVKGLAPGFLQNQPRPLSARSPQFQVRRAALASSPKPRLKMNKTETHTEPVAKIAERNPKISPKPTVGHSSAMSASVGHLTPTHLKHNTAVLDGSTVKHRF